MNIITGLTPATTMPLGHKPPATMTSNPARTKVQPLDSFIPSTPAQRSGTRLPQPPLTEVLVELLDRIPPDLLSTIEKTWLTLGEQEEF